MIDPLDDSLAELSAELDVDPSPEFAARVRTSIASDGRARHWRWALVAATSMTVVGLTLWLRQPAPVDAPAVRARIALAAESPRVPFDAAGPQERRPQQVAAVGQRAVAGRVAMRRVVSRPEPETLIAPDQAIAFQRLVRLVYEGRIVAPSSDWPKTSSLDPVEPPADVTVAPVEVKPVVINPLIIDTMSDQEV
jgi:hypothetical protein